MKPRGFISPQKKKSRISHRDSCSAFILFSVVCGVLLSAYPAWAQQSVLTLRDAEYRNRWAGPQEDRVATPQYFEPGGGLDDESAKTKKDEAAEA